MSYTMERSLKEKIELMQLVNTDNITNHTHNFLEIAYICSGEAEYGLGKEKGVLKECNYFIVDYGTSHDYFSRKGNLNIINCLFLPEIINKAFADVRSFNELCERYFFHITGRNINGPASNTVFDDDGTVGELFLKMLNEYNEKKDGYREKIRCLLCEVIIETIRKVGSQVKISPVTADILKEIENNYSKKICLNEICKKLHYSLSYVSAKFHSDTGLTFTDYLQKCRIEESCRLLCYTNQSILEIAEKTGYTSIKFFNKIFRKITGTTPREYRKNFKV